MSGRQQRVMVQPIVSGSPVPYFRSSLILQQNVIFKNLQQVSSVLLDSCQYSLSQFQKTKIVIWLYDNIEMRIEGRIIVRVLRSNFLAHCIIRNSICEKTMARLSS
jgi:hypothetical protein